MSDAVRRRSSFNLIHLATMLKVDVFVRKDRPFEAAAFERVARGALDEAPDARAFIWRPPRTSSSSSWNGFA